MQRQQLCPGEEGAWYERSGQGDADGLVPADGQEVDERSQAGGDDVERCKAVAQIGRHRGGSSGGGRQGEH